MAFLLAPRALSFMATIIKSSRTRYSQKGAVSNAPWMWGLLCVFCGGCCVCSVLQKW
jgi:hypothetical protein